MSEPFIGQVMLFGGNFAPRGWAFCDGSLLAIATNTALFSILGTTFGGNGQTTFGLPDLRGRAAIGMGNGPGLTPRVLGEMAGEENHTLIVTEMPAHNHAVAVAASNEGNGQTRPVGNIPGTGAVYETPAGASGSLGGVTCGLTGGSQPHNNMQPYTAMNYIIALEGVYPSRN